MARLTHEEIVDRLTTLGLRFRTVRVQTEGDYLPTDVDWNNKDVLHLNHIHRWVNDVTFVVDRDLQASVSLQKAAGIPFPLVLVHYDNGPNHQTHVVTLLAWTIVTHHEFIAVTPTRTRAVTTYAVGASRLWTPLFPLVRWAIRRNYRQLMAEDVPMRERRGHLRSWGYRFRGDDGVRDIRASRLGRRRQRHPPRRRVPDDEPWSTPLDRLADGASVLVGRSDHLGDFGWSGAGTRCSCTGGCAPTRAPSWTTCRPRPTAASQCPWHGRRLEPLATLPLADAPDAGHRGADRGEPGGRGDRRAGRAGERDGPVCRRARLTVPASPGGRLQLRRRRSIQPPRLAITAPATAAMTSASQSGMVISIISQLNVASSVFWKTNASNATTRTPSATIAPIGPLPLSPSAMARPYAPHRPVR